MKIRRWSRYALAGMLIGAASFSAWKVLRPWPRLSDLHYHQLELGMTLDEVEMHVGVPPGVYATPVARTRSSMAAYCGSIVYSNLIHTRPWDVAVLHQIQAEAHAPNMRYWQTRTRALCALADEKGSVVGILYLELTGDDWLDRALQRFQDLFGH